MTDNQKAAVKWLNDRVNMIMSADDLQRLGIPVNDSLHLTQRLQIFGLYHLYKLIGYELGLVLDFATRDDEDYPNKVFFMYKDIEFFEVLTDEEREEIENAITSN